MFKQPVKLLFKQLSWLLMLCGCTIVSVRPSAIVSTIEPSEDALSMEDVVKFFSPAFEQICGLSVVIGLWHIGLGSGMLDAHLHLAWKDYFPKLLKVIQELVEKGKHVVTESVL